MCIVLGVAKNSTWVVWDKHNPVRRLARVRPSGEPLPAVAVHLHVLPLSPRPACAQLGKNFLLAPAFEKPAQTRPRRPFEWGNEWE